MRIAVIQFPGSNCERETALAIKRAGMEPVDFLWNEPKEKLTHCDGFVIVGGFSYEDRSRAGIIAALDPIMQILKEQSALGKPILGICNGAQILVESGLVPGIEDHKVGMVLTDNKRIQKDKVLGTGFYNAWVNMRLADHYQLNAFTRCLKPNTVLHLPVAHGEGRFVIPPALLAEMTAQGQTVFQYCDEQGDIHPEFPTNPNGSINNIAAVSNKAGNVMAMMPHPERTPNGDLIFQSMREYIKAGHVQTVQPLNYYPRELALTKFKKNTSHELIVELMITDNQALTVENALNHLNKSDKSDKPLKIKRQIHWEIDCESPAVLEKIIASGVLFNPRKEKISTSKSTAAKTSAFLVRPKENMIGRQKQQMLEDHFNIKGIRLITYSVLWQVETVPAFLNSILDSHILFNPYAHDYYEYVIN